MKSGTIINKIIGQIDSHAEAMKALLGELEESLQKENIKMKEDLAKKIAQSFNLDLDQVLKKVIKKKKKDMDLTNQLEQINLDEENSNDFIPIYKKITHEGKDYFYDDKPDGIVFETDENTSVTKIVGYIDLDTKSIKFT
jgi:hypothetical protein